MPNLIDWIRKSANESDIEAVVIGNMDWNDYGSEDVPNYDKIPKGKVISWEEAKKWLDYEFDSGYGAPGCNAIYVWTTDKILFVSQYDGATGIESIPRNPTDIMPEMPGGG